LFSLSESEFLDKTQGSPIRRIGYLNWQRNLSVAMGNASYDAGLLKALQRALETANDAVLIEHFRWAIAQQQDKKKSLERAVSTRQQQRLIRIIQKGLPRDA